MGVFTNMGELAAYLTSQPFEQVIAFAALIVAGLALAFGIMVLMKRGN
jgi:hypothetical protein